jgi:hypothetical protein
MEDAVIGYATLPYHTELMRVLINAQCPLFYERNPLVNFVYHDRYGSVSVAVRAFIIAVLSKFDSYKIVLVSSWLSDAEFLCERIFYNGRGSGIELEPQSSIKPDGTHVVGAQLKFKGHRSVNTLVSIPAWNCNIQLLKGADLIICLDMFNHGDDFVRRLFSLQTPRVFVTRGHGLLEYWFRDAYDKDYQYYKWLRRVILELNLPKELLSHISGFAFKGGGRE